MSSQLLQQLEYKIEQAIEAIEFMRLQIDELEEKNKHLTDSNNALTDKLQAWENNLSTMLEKLTNVDKVMHTNEKA